MHGVLINLRGEEPLSRYRRCGVYATRMDRPPFSRQGWRPAGEGTIADYLALREGDLVFFFCGRLIYGIGRVVRLPGTRRAALCNYRYAWDLRVPPSGNLLWEDEPNDPLDHPFVFFFEPYPRWFPHGVDMDEALSADAHGYVTILPFFARVSFARLDHFEAAHLAWLVARCEDDASDIPDEHERTHLRARECVAASPDEFEIDVDALVRQYSEGGQVRHEALLEAWFIDALTNRWGLVRDVFARDNPWAFVGRQVPASPFKPPEYVDRIDILAYDVAPAVPDCPIPVIRGYLAAELKAGAATMADVLQTMKYVDWIAQTRQGGEYVGIQAMLVAAEFPDEVLRAARTETTRRYVRPRRPYGTSEWCDFRLLRYAVQEDGPAIALERVL